MDADNRSVLLTVSGQIPPGLADDVRGGRRPVPDYEVMREHFDADIVDVVRALNSTGRVGRLIHKFVGVGGLLGWYCFRVRSRYDVIVTDGEQVGLPYALLERVFGRGAARHLMIVHVLTVPKKSWLLKATRTAPMIDRFATYSSVQTDYVVRELRVPPDRVVTTTFMVDTSFFDPDAVEVSQRRMICSAGLERRDYSTLIRAVAGLDVEVVIAAASPWSKRSAEFDGVALPPNVTVEQFDLHALRELYAASLFVVMPLLDVDFQAGITTILEAMSMERAVVVTKTVGQTDTIVEAETGRYVGVGDVEDLRRTIQDLLDDPAERMRLGSNARQWVVENADVHRYASRLGGLVSVLRAETR